MYIVNEHREVIGNQDLQKKYGYMYNKDTAPQTNSDFERDMLGFVSDVNQMMDKAGYKLQNTIVENNFVYFIGINKTGQKIKVSFECTPGSPYNSPNQGE